MKTIDTLGADFVRKHDWLLQAARLNEVALCGGCAAAISKGRSDYIPADLDFVTTKANALRLLDQINHFLIERSIHYRVYVNSHNDFVPEPAVAHFRVQTPFWLPVCLFVVPHDQFRFYRIEKGHLLQLPQDVKQAADHMTERDEKPRLANEEPEQVEIEPVQDRRDDDEGWWIEHPAEEDPESAEQEWWIERPRRDDPEPLPPMQPYPKP